MESGESLITICKPLCDKVKFLKTYLQFLKCVINNKPDSLKIVKQIDNLISVMLTDLEKLQQLLEEKHTLHNEMKVEEIEISHLLYKVDVLQKQISTCQDNDSSYCQVTNGSIASEHLESPAQCIETNSCIEFSPIELKNAPSSVSRKNLKPQSIAFDIAYLTTEDYKLIPKYMVGRLTLEAINKFVDVINDAFSKKYNILSKTVSSLKTQEMSLYRKYKRQQNSELKGEHFVAEEDIAREYNKPVLEKKAYNFLTILRHTKRLVRDVINGNTVYIATSPEWSNI